MIFRDLPRGARFRCHLPDIRSPVVCVKLSKTRFRVIGGTYHKTKVDSFTVALIPKQDKPQ